MATAGRKEVGDRADVQVLDLTTDNQGISVGNAAGSLKLKLPAVALKVSADAVVAVSGQNCQGGAGHVQNGANLVKHIGSLDGDCQGPKAVNSAINVPEKTFNRSPI